MAIRKGAPSMIFQPLSGKRQDVYIHSREKKVIALSHKAPV